MQTCGKMRIIGEAFLKNMQNKMALNVILLIIGILFHLLDYWKKRYTILILFICFNCYLNLKKGAQGVLQYHNGSLSQALMQLFPSIPFDRSKFQFRQSIYIFLSFSPYTNCFKIEFWNQEKNRRDFFVEYALKSNFDPLVADHWHTNINDVMATKVIYLFILYMSL